MKKPIMIVLVNIVIILACISTPITSTPTPSPTPTPLSVSLPLNAPSTGWNFIIHEAYVHTSVTSDSNTVEPENGAFLILIGNLENNDTSSDCMTTSAWELTNSDTGQDYNYNFYAESVVTDLYNLDAPGSFIGTCLDSKETKRLFVVFDIDPKAELTLTFRKNDSGQPVQLHSALSIVNAPTPLPTKTPKSTNMPSSTSMPAEPKTGLIPGLQPDDVKLNLVNRKFTCELVFAASDSDPYYKWECKSKNTEYYILVEIWSRSLFSVDLIQSSIMQFGIPDNNLASDFLGFMATTPYDGSEPQNARTWVENTLPTITENGDVRENTFGSIIFRLYGIPTARFLNIGDDLPFP